MSDGMRQGDAVDDVLLVERAQRGDATAMDELLAMHQDRVYRTALGLVGGDQEAALEIAQEVLISVSRHIGQFRGASKFSTWLYRMTVNFSKNRAVAEGRRSARFFSIDRHAADEEGETAPRDFAAERPSPREIAHGRELMDALHEHLARLSSEYREILVLRYVEDVSYEEIAELLGIPIGTVKSRINRARRELRSQMGHLLDAGGETP